MAKEWTFADMNRVAFVKQAVDGQITTVELAKFLSLSERQAWRLKRKFVSNGQEAIRHGNTGKKPSNRISDEQKTGILNVFSDWRDHTDEGLNASHLSDILLRDHKIKVSRQTCWRFLKQSSFIIDTRKVRKHRKRRDRRTQEGDILYLDGSPHRWFGQKYPKSTLILCIDDATSKALGAMFTPEEDRNSCFRVTYEVFKKYGLPRSFWLDRASQFTTTRGEGQMFKQTPGPTHWENAMYCLGVKVIYANSPQARGRGERANGTFQDRLAVELQYNNITAEGEATRYMNEVFIPSYNKQFGVEPSNPEPAWRMIPEGMDLRTILAARFERKVLNDNTVKHNGIRYHLWPLSKNRGVARDRVEVQQWYDGSFHVIHPNLGELKCEAKREFDGHRRALHPDIIAVTGP